MLISHMKCYLFGLLQALDMKIYFSTDIQNKYTLRHLANIL